MKPPKHNVAFHEGVVTKVAHAFNTAYPSIGVKLEAKGSFANDDKFYKNKQIFPSFDSGSRKGTDVSMFFHDRALFTALERPLREAAEQRFSKQVYELSVRYGRNGGDAIYARRLDTDIADLTFPGVAAGMLARLFRATRPVISGVENTWQDQEADFADEVLDSLIDDERRRKRLLKADSQAPERERSVRDFLRNPDVVAERLRLAEGRCEVCKVAPFLTRRGNPYLEVHHVLSLADGGPDTVDNVRALCPSCHREQHHGRDAPRLS